MKETPVLLLTGYLGSGKTTLLNRILANTKGIKFAVIVNDLGEVNIDADLIREGGIVGNEKGADDLVALQNGCICCTLQTDLIRQVSQLCNDNFDYIVIEASGICEPAPIAQTICAMQRAIAAPDNAPQSRPRLDCICTVVDALRLKSEFNSGKSLQNENIDEEDIENLIIEQIEFCNIILLNKIDEVSHEDAEIIKAVIRAIQPDAKIIETNYCDVDLSLLLNTDDFNFERTAMSATWVKEIEGESDSPNSQNSHNSHNSHNHDHHHHDHDHGEAEEYGISTFVYFRREPFDFDKFERFVSTEWPAGVIRTKGVLYFSHNKDMSLLFEQAGVQKNIREAGLWLATAPVEELRQMAAADPSILRDWDETYGDRMIKLVFIGRNMDKEKIIKSLDNI